MVIRHGGDGDGDGALLKFLQFLVTAGVVGG